uniref:Interferon-induced GTP-binding protein MxE-like n=1 Tax=Cyprinus carpio TaxID=7962 RepID=A0A8C2B1B4_CYPCA
MSESSSLNQHYEEKVRPCIDLVDSLRALGLEKDLNLPAIAVIGDQSSGKSSVLEALSGVSLPRGTGIVTRCPLVLKLKKFTKDKNWHGLLSYKDQIKTLNDPEDVENAVLYAQGVLAGNGEGISHEMITLEIQSCDVPDLTLIDLPGIARVATANQPKDIDKQIKDLIKKFIQRQETICLVVVPANVDITTTEALQMASEVDSTGERTLGVLTKPDLVDKGMEKTVVRTVNNDIITLKKGYMIVKCRGQNDINERLDLARALEKERIFFEEHDDFRSLLEEKATIPLLAKRLTNELFEHIVVRIQSYMTYKKKKCHIFCALQKISQFNDALERVKKAEEDVKIPNTRVFNKIRVEFQKWRSALNAKAIKTEDILRVEVKEYVRTHRGMELPGFLNYRTFVSIITEYIEEMEEPALKMLKDVTDIVHSSVDHIVNTHFNALSHLESAAKEQTDCLLDKQFQKAKKKIRSQFKMEKIVYSQDDLYSDQLCNVKRKSNANQGLLASFVNADVRDMGYHLISYLTITTERLANQVPLIVLYHTLNKYIAQLQCEMLVMTRENDPGMLLQEDSGIERKRNELREQLKRLQRAGIALSKYKHSA